MAGDNRPTFENESYGFGGVGGQKFIDIPGWENGTVGFAGNIFSRLAAQNGIQPVDPAILAAREPFKTGRFIVKMLKTPPFFNKTASRLVRYIFEDTVKDVSGLTEYSIDTFQTQNGVIRQNSNFMSIFKENNGEFTLKVPETAGQLVRKALDYWMYGISDPKTGVCHFYGKNLRAVQPNKAASFIYILLGPTCRADDIEYACMWHEATPTAPKVGHNNSSLGEAGSGVEHDVSFSGIFDKGPEIDALAYRIVKAYGLYGERFTDAALPDYIYKQYFNGADLSKADYGIDIESRLNAEIGLDVADKPAYDSGDVTLRGSIRTSGAGFDAGSGL
jgi:hypothetical protein